MTLLFFKVFSFMIYTLLHAFERRSIFSLRKQFLWLKKILLIQTNFLWSKEIDLFTLKKIYFNQQNFLQFKDIFSLSVFQRNVSLIQRNCFLGIPFCLRHLQNMVLSNYLGSNGKQIFFNILYILVKKDAFDCARIRARDFRYIWRGNDQKGTKMIFKTF